MEYMSKVVMTLLLFCRQSPCDLTRYYRNLYFVFFTLPKGFNSGEYTFHSIQAPSNSIHLQFSRECLSIKVGFFK